jgi:hypothetical protein
VIQREETAGQNGAWAADVIIEHYLGDFVLKGGASVKVACGTPGNVRSFQSRIMAAARELGYLTVSLDAADYRVHLVHKFFFAISKQIQWLEIADRFARKVLADISYDVPADQPLNLEAIAGQNDVHPGQLRKRVDAALRSLVLKNPNYTRTFKSVILVLVGATLEREGMDRARGLRVVEWLRGEASDRKTLATANLTRLINRHNARALLGDLARWTRAAGLPGLVVCADVSRYATKLDAGDPGLRYSGSAALDLYEMVRQFVDAADETVGLFLLFVTGEQFLTDSKRGLSSYSALKMRLLDDVYDSDRPNLLAPLVVV